MTAKEVEKMRRKIEKQIKIMKTNMDIINGMIKTINSVETNESLDSKILYNEVLYDLFEDLHNRYFVGAVMTEEELERLDNIKDSESS